VGDEAELRNALTQWDDLMSSAIETQVQQQVDAALRGITPPASPAREQRATLEELVRIVDETAGKPGREEDYKQAKAQLDELYDQQ